jgi:hypothetical protein
VRRHLPPGLRTRITKAGVTFYYLKLSGQDREIALGTERSDALDQWQQHRLARFTQNRPVNSLTRLIDCFVDCAVPLRDLADRPALLRQAAMLRSYFDGLGNPQPGDPIPGADVYLEQHGTDRRNRSGGEIYLFVHMWKWTQRKGLLPAETECPWCTRTVADTRKQETFGELWEAIRVLRQKSLPAVGSVSEIATEPPSAKMHQHQIAAHLAADGRPDLARYLRSLNNGALEVLFSGEYTMESDSSASLTLGSRRIDRLRVMKGQSNSIRGRTSGRDV